jgi:hypothetical protein
MPIRKEDIVAFVDRFENGLRRVSPGVSGIEFDSLKAIVGEVDPDLVSLVVHGYIKAARETKTRGYYQRASALATVYELLSGDDTLTELVKSAAQKDGVEDAAPQFRALDEVGAAKPQPERKGYHFQIDEKLLASGDVYGIVRFLSFERATKEKIRELAGLRGRCVITFDLPDDGKYVWEDPRARTVVKRLFDAMPYFPYFLEPQPERNHMPLFYMCLADPEVCANGVIDLSHDSIIDPAVSTIVSIAGVCKKTGEEYEKVTLEAFAAWPATLVDYLLRRAGDVIRGGA